MPFHGSYELQKSIGLLYARTDYTLGPVRAGGPGISFLFPNSPPLDVPENCPYYKHTPDGSLLSLSVLFCHFFCHFVLWAWIDRWMIWKKTFSFRVHFVLEPCATLSPLFRLTTRTGQLPNLHSNAIEPPPNRLHRMLT